MSRTTPELGPHRPVGDISMAPVGLGRCFRRQPSARPMRVNDPRASVEAIGLSTDVFQGTDCARRRVARHWARLVRPSGFPTSRRSTAPTAQARTAGGRVPWSASASLLITARMARSGRDRLVHQFADAASQQDAVSSSPTVAHRAAMASSAVSR